MTSTDPDPDSETGTEDLTPYKARVEPSSPENEVIKPIGRQELMALMQRGQVIRTGPPQHYSLPRGIPVPWVCQNEQGEEYCSDKRWQLLLGYSVAYPNYRGPSMACTETMPDGMADHILQNPGLYVVVAVHDGMHEPTDWAVAHQPDYPTRSAFDPRNYVSGEYRIEIRSNFSGSLVETETEAQRLAALCRGEVTAIFDALNDFEEV